MGTMSEVWTNTGSALASLVFIYTIFERFFPAHRLREHFEPLAQRLVGLVYPYLQITFHEYSGQRFKRSDVYDAIQSYLSKDSSSRAKKLTANRVKGNNSIVLSMDDHEEITDEFEGVKVWWQAKKHQSESRSISFYPKAEESRFYMLKFHRCDRQVITERYLDHVMREGKIVGVKNRERKLYSNNPSENWSGYKQTKWSHVTFEHPATFDTLAMEDKKKEEIKNDLIKFSKSKDYYKKIGKAWKRGYLLFGPPGTGKSTMIAAMANFLEYDVYDLELTTVKDNTELRRLLIETSVKSIIVIEDIDCSLDLTGQRKQKEEEEEEDGDETNPIEKQLKKEKGENKGSKVTLSGLLNFIDGLWSSCGGERIIVFTTNFIDKLDPALIRKGRMDKRIEMSYCGLEAFKLLAKNYLDAKEEDDSELFDEIKRLLEVEEIKMTPADVGENLLKRSEVETKEFCLKRLIEALKEEKEEAKRRIEDEEKKKKEEEDTKRKKREEKKTKSEEKEQNGIATKEV
ncbi:PREDICTED: AAA-ATPase ASD, mitochondrial [Camelina sativa]|uniref:AAA-ATPase ASD, mitochondrial n=1 Tax=Camelina sativa TaxID=90675 RepID=A0ABM0V4R3_CAMSA|nr:PREDICTED: AAA-ATPase ASD, mitochondrial [Camelina sativa]